LTEKARAIVVAIAGLSDEVRGEAFVGLTAGEGDQLLDLLWRVHANLAGRTPVAAERDRDAGMRRRPPHRRELAPDLMTAGGRP
jgi:hypothetical protein